MCCLFVVCCLLSDVCCLWFVHCVLSVVCAVCCLPCVWWLLLVVCGWLCACCTSCVMCCVCVACCAFCCLFVGRCVSWLARSLVFVMRLLGRAFSVCWLMFGVCCLLRVDLLFAVCCCVVCCSLCVAVCLWLLRVACFFKCWSFVVYVLCVV